MPTCLPRDTIVRLPLPEDASVDEVIPSHVVVKRCSGVCHEGNVYHQCVPKSGARTTQGRPDDDDIELDLHPAVHIHKYLNSAPENRDRRTTLSLCAFQEFEVLLRKTNAVGMSEMACSTVHIESHDSCKCGCDVEAAQCSDLQVSPCSVNIKEIHFKLGILCSYQRLYIVEYTHSPSMFNKGCCEIAHISVP